MNPVIYVQVTCAEDILFLNDIIANANAQYNDIGITPHIYIFSHFPYASLYHNVHVIQDESCINKLLIKYPNSYIIYQRPTVTVRPNIYKWIHCEMENGHTGILFHWPNLVCPTNCWLLDFYVFNDIKLMPHRNINDEHDCLEVAWGKYLVANNIYGYLKSHNSNNNKFIVNTYPEKIIEAIVVDDEIETVQSNKSWWPIIKRWLLWQR